MTFGDRLKELRLERGLTQSEFGEKVGISGRVIGYYESGDRFPKDEKALLSIVKHLGVSLDWLLGQSKNRYIEAPNENVLFINVANLNSEERAKILEYAEMIQKLHVPD